MRTIIKYKNQPQQQEEDKTEYYIALIYKALVVNWKLFLLSLLLSLGCAFLYLRFKQPVYNTFAKILIKGEQQSDYSVETISDLGVEYENYGIENELQILYSTSVSSQAVSQQKLYVTYSIDSRFSHRELYDRLPFTVDVDPFHLYQMNSPLTMTIKRKEKKYDITGQYFLPVNELDSEGPYPFHATVGQLPAVLRTKAGNIYLTPGKGELPEDVELHVSVISPDIAATKYINRLSIAPTSKSSSVLTVQLQDEIPIRAVDFLKQFITAYNQLANDDKNEVASKTERFINDRIEKISNELSNTEKSIEDYKRRNRITEMSIDKRQTTANENYYQQRINDADIQIDVISSLLQLALSPSNEYQVLPTNIGLNDQTATQLIREYNTIALERNRLLRTASSSSPMVMQQTDQLKDLSRSIRLALQQARRNAEIERNNLIKQQSRYENEASNTPQQERVLNAIGRQQEVKSGLYLMLLQKREENSIKLASTADKCRVIERPQYAGKISPKNRFVYLIALFIGLLLPILIIYIKHLLNYTIQGHEDIALLTKLPIIADIPLANEHVKKKADIVIHENDNSQMQEIFRSLRTSIQFLLEKGEKTITFTSNSSGEGKTFVTSNLAMSFAFLGKKVILIGLDIRKPRLAELFEINDHSHGITRLLMLDNPSWSDVQQQIVPSGMNDNLDLLMSGPIPPNPAELISRDSLETVFQLLNEHYDVIVVDTAPVGLVTDTLQLGRVSSATVFVCRADYTPKSCFEQINSMSDQNTFPKMCIVINGIDMSKNKNRFYYGYGIYGKYGKYGRYGRYGHYGRGKAHFGNYGNYGTYGSFRQSNYGSKNDSSIKQ